MMSFFSVCIHAQEDDAETKAMKKHLEGTDGVDLRTVKNQEVQKYLMENAQMDECKKKIYQTDDISQKGLFLDMTKNELVVQCFRDELANLDDEDLQNLSEDLNLEGYGVIKDKSTSSIKAYFDDRLENVIFGVDKNDKETKIIADFKNQKFVDQSMFFKIYESQLGKNLLVDLSEFCLHQVEVVNTCTGPNSKICIKKRTSAFDKNELTLKFRQSPADLKKEWETCARSVQFACKEYASNQVSTDTTDLKGTGTPDDDTELGRVSCLVVNRIKEYRKTLSEVLKTKAELENKNQGAGFTIQSAFKGMFQGIGDDNIDNLTNIGSKTISTQYSDDSYKQDQQMAEACKDNYQSAKECEEIYSSYFKTKDKNDQNKLLVDYELKVAGLVKKHELEVDGIQDSEITEYLQKSGETKLIDEIKNGKSIADIKLEIKKQFEAEKQAIINELRKKITREYEITTTDSSTDINKKLNNLVENVKNKKDRLKNVYQYSNIVTSYLETKDGDGVVIGSNANAFKAEIDDYQDDDTTSKYLKGLSGTTPTTGADTDDGKNLTVDLNFIDKLLDKQ